MKWRVGKWLAVTAELSNSHVVDWKAVPVLSHEPTVLYGWLDNGEYHEDPEKAHVYASGHIKWDGCINMVFVEQKRCMLHFCGHEHAIEKLGEMFDLIHQAAMEMCDPYRSQHEE